MKTRKVLFICTHNSTRSQLAEGLVNHYFNNWRAYSAGTKKTIVNSLAIRAMKEVDIEISHHSSKLLDEFLNEKMDLVVTVCDSAKEACPYFPNAKKMIHIGFEDPSNVDGSDDIKLKAFINTRNQIKNWLENNLKLYE